MKAGDNGYLWEKRLGWHVCVFLTALVLALSASGTASALVPPEWMLYNQLLNSVGQTPGVTVSEPIGSGGKYKIKVTSGDFAQRSALATILARQSGMNVVVRVMDPEGNVQKPLAVKGRVPEKLITIMELFDAAFEGNPLYVRTKVSYGGGIYGVFPIFEAKVVQFYCDNLSDYNGNRSFVAADLFQLVLNPAIGGIYLSLSTQSMDTVGGAYSEE